MHMKIQLSQHHLLKKIKHSWNHGFGIWIIFNSVLSFGYLFLSHHVNYIHTHTHIYNLYIYKLYTYITYIYNLYIIFFTLCPHLSLEKLSSSQPQKEATPRDLMIIAFGPDWLDLQVGMQPKLSPLDLSFGNLTLGYWGCAS